MIDKIIGSSKTLWNLVHDQFFKKKLETLMLRLFRRKMIFEK
jgi:hypothetical protein